MPGLGGFIADVYAQHNVIPTWPVGMRTAVGDVVSLGPDGELIHETTVENLLHPSVLLPAQRRLPAEDRFIVSGDVDMRAGGVASAPTLSAKLRFKKRMSYYMQVEGGHVQEYIDYVDVRKLLGELVRVDSWQWNWALITYVRTASECGLLVSDTPETELDVRISASPAAAAGKDGIQLDLGAGVSRLRGVDWRDRSECTPLYKAVRPVRSRKGNLKHSGLVAGRDHSSDLPDAEYFRVSIEQVAPDASWFDNASEHSD